jgi:plastocyanin
VRGTLCWILGCSLSLVAGSAPLARAQEVDVSAKITMIPQKPSHETSQKDSLSGADVVVWLTPLRSGFVRAAAPPHSAYRLVQKNKMFSPHLLVVPTGTNVEFPNEDPFFHNVFSLFNGKRFDLGLYESGSTRSVRFDREGVSYIFCNIHPEMGAIVLSLNTSYFAVSTTNGELVIHHVPQGSYRLNVWSETAQPTKPSDAERIVQVGSEPVQLGEIALQRSASPLVKHKNKFGEEYRPNRDPHY